MATSTFIHNSVRKRNLNTLIETHIKVLKTSKLAYAMLISIRNAVSTGTNVYVSIGCVGFARYFSLRWIVILMSSSYSINSRVFLSKLAAFFCQNFWGSLFYFICATRRNYKHDRGS